MPFQVPAVIVPRPVMPVYEPAIAAVGTVPLVSCVALRAVSEVPTPENEPAVMRPEAVKVESEVVAKVEVPETVKAFNVPTDVSDEVTTVAFKVVPLSVPAGAITTAVEAAVMSPLPLTVKVGMAVDEPNEPTLLLTVAKVVPRAPAVVVISPVRAGKRAAAKVPVTWVPERLTAFAVKAWPVRER